MHSDDIDVKLTKQQKAHLRYKASKMKKSTAVDNSLEKQPAKVEESKKVILVDENSEDQDSLTKLGEDNQNKDVIITSSGIATPSAMIDMDVLDSEDFVMVEAVNALSLSGIIS
ncbi:MAG: hypothetical protein WBJ81_02770 [Rickettsiales bacterium]